MYMTVQGRVDAMVKEDYGSCHECSSTGRGQLQPNTVRVTERRERGKEGGKKGREEEGETIRSGIRDYTKGADQRVLLVSTGC